MMSSTASALSFGGHAFWLTQATVFVDTRAAVAESEEANNTHAEKFEVRGHRKHH